MQISKDLRLFEAKPSDRPHILVWDSPNEADIEQLCFYNSAERVNYRETLLSRVTPGDQFLVLDQYLDREFDAIRSICTCSGKKVVIMEGLDVLITYLSVKPGGFEKVFWQRFAALRHLDSVLWILLPERTIPIDWPNSRLMRIEFQ